MTCEPAHLGRSIAKSALWMIVLRTFIRAVGVANTIIVARILVPADYGLIALAMLISESVELLTSFGFDVALIRDQEARREHYDTAWTLTVLRGVVNGGLLLLLATPLALWFEEPRVEPIIYATSLVLVLNGLQNIAVVDFQKDLQFDRYFWFLASAKVFGFAVTVLLAFLWRSYWALVGGMLAAAVWRLVASYTMHPFRPRLSLATWRELFDFTKWLLVHNILTVARTRADRFIIGKLDGLVAVGLYTLAFEIASLLTREFLAPLRRSLLPGYARLSHDIDQLRRVLIETIGLSVWIGGPIAIGLALLADPVVIVLLGAKWRDAVPIVQVLAVSGFVGLLSSASLPAFLALGRPQNQTLLSAVGAVILVPALIYAVRAGGAMGAALAVSAVQVVLVAVDLLLLRRLMGLPLMQIGRVIWRSALATGVMAVAIALVEAAWPAGTSTVRALGLLVAAGGAGALAYLAASFGLWCLFSDERGPERHVLKVLIEALAFLRLRSA